MERFIRSYYDYYYHHLLLALVAELVSKIDGAVTVEHDKKLQGFFARMETRMTEVRTEATADYPYNGLSSRLLVSQTL